ncbi:MAG: carbohydrate porin [Reichenbachiella sp.]
MIKDTTRRLSLLVMISLGFILSTHGQSAIDYIIFKETEKTKVGFGSYGRIGVSWLPTVSSTDGRRLNLNNMGSIGGRMEEQDYIELGMAYHLTPDVLNEDSTEIVVQFRSSVYSNNLQYFGNSSTTDALSALTIALPEIFIEARNVLTKDLNVWVGARLYRGGDTHMADYFYFNDHSGQGFGAEYKGSRLHFNFVSSSDTSATVPPYFYLNIKSGTPSLALRRRVVNTFEQDVKFGKNDLLTLLAEYHHMGDPSSEELDSDSTGLLSYPGDNGWVLGAKYQLNELPGFLPGSFNHVAVRFGSGIANGGDGGNSRTWLTYGAANLETNTFDNAYSWHIVDHFLLNLSERMSLNGYVIYNKSKGAASTNGKAETFLGKEVYNSKQDWTVGFKLVNYITDQFHWQTEIHHSRRKDGLDPTNAMTKLSLVPTIAPRGARSVWTRPHIRFVYSVARYNDAARDGQYSPYLDVAGQERWGHYFGVKAEWWTW